MKLADITLYEDDAIIIINKPAGLTVHPDGKNESDTLSEMILEEHPEMKFVGEPLTVDSGEVIMRPGIVHRLDKDTSGVMVITKTQDAYSSLKQQFHDHVVKKHYTALVFGSFRHIRGQINQPIGRSNQDIRKWAAGVHARGEKRESLTLYTVAGSGKVLGSDGQNYTISSVDIYPQTGRTHQIRVHMQYIQHPIIGDSLYASYVPEILGMNRQALHSKEIKFKHPTTGKSVSFEAPLPQDMENAIKQLGL